MDCFSRVFSPTWMPTVDQAWVSNDGQKINLKNDVAICVTKLENRIMHALAVDELTQRYDISVKTCPHGSKIPKESTGSKYLRRVNTVMNPFYRPYNIFGMDLEEAVKIDRTRSTFTQLRINDGYNLNVPYFLAESVRCIEKYGLSKNDIFKKIKHPIRLSQMKTLVTSGNEFHFNTGKDVLEVAMLLKIYLEKMPEGLFTTALEFHVVNATEFPIDERVKFLNLVVQALPRINREALYLLLSLLRTIVRAPTNSIKSQELNDIFTPVLFRARWIIACNAMGILKDLIIYFPGIFTLKVKQLDQIYRQMSANRPRKVHESLQRRIHQCHCDESDIPASMHILTSQMRSFDAFKITLHRELNFRRERHKNFFDPHYHNHLDKNIHLKKVNQPPPERATDFEIQLQRTAFASQPKPETTSESEKSLSSVELQSITTARVEDLEPYVPLKYCRRVSQKLTDGLPDLDFDKPSTSRAAAAMAAAYFCDFAEETFSSPTAAPIELTADSDDESDDTETPFVIQTVAEIADVPSSSPKMSDPESDGEVTDRKTEMEMTVPESQTGSDVAGFLEMPSVDQAEADEPYEPHKSLEEADDYFDLDASSTSHPESSESDTNTKVTQNIADIEQPKRKTGDLEPCESYKPLDCMETNDFTDPDPPAPSTSHSKSDSKEDYKFFKSSSKVRQYVAEIESGERSKVSTKPKLSRGSYTLQPRKRLVLGFEVKERYTPSQTEVERRTFSKTRQEGTDPDMELKEILSIRRGVPPLGVKTTAL